MGGDRADRLGIGREPGEAVGGTLAQIGGFAGVRGQGQLGVGEQRVGGGGEGEQRGIQPGRHRGRIEAEVGGPDDLARAHRYAAGHLGEIFAQRDAGQIDLEPVERAGMG
ncbi:MAG: hypothetical protein ACKOEE_05680, partial [Tagaea sp.]